MKKEGYLQMSVDIDKYLIFEDFLVGFGVLGYHELLEELFQYHIF